MSTLPYRPRSSIRLYVAVLSALLSAAVVACREEISGDALSFGPGVLFADEFVAGRTGQWHVEQDELGMTAVIGERLVVEIAAPNLMQYSALQGPTFDDFDLQVDVTQLAGNPESSFGILFRMESANEFYRFDVTGDGRYIVERRDIDGSWTRLTDDWTPTEALHQGHNVTNHLRVVARGDQLSFYANDELIERVRDGTYSRGMVALDAGTFGEPGLSVAFDNLIIREP